MKDVKLRNSLIPMEQGDSATEQAGLPIAFQGAEKDGSSQRSPLAVQEATLFEKIAFFFRYEEPPLAASGDVTLEQLHERLMAAAVKDRKERRRFDEMMFVMAFDIREAKAFPLAGVPAGGVARSMNAWRERYGGFDGYLDR